MPRANHRSLPAYALLFFFLLTSGSWSQELHEGPARMVIPDGTPSAETQIRAGAVLPGSSSSEHQATGALPQSADKTGSTGQHLVERTQENRRRHARR
jgi:hypothetical protein